MSGPVVSAQRTRELAAAGLAMTDGQDSNESTPSESDNMRRFRESFSTEPGLSPDTLAAAAAAQESRRSSIGDTRASRQGGEAGRSRRRRRFSDSQSEAMKRAADAAVAESRMHKSARALVPAPFPGMYSGNNLSSGSLVPAASRSAFGRDSFGAGLTQSSRVGSSTVTEHLHARHAEQSAPHDIGEQLVATQAMLSTLLVALNTSTPTPKAPRRTLSGLSDAAGADDDDDDDDIDEEQTVPILQAAPNRKSGNAAAAAALAAAAPLPNPNREPALTIGPDGRPVRNEKPRMLPRRSSRVRSQIPENFTRGFSSGQMDGDKSKDGKMRAGGNMGGHADSDSDSDERTGGDVMPSPSGTGEVGTRGRALSWRGGKGGTDEQARSTAKPAGGWPGRRLTENFAKNFNFSRKKTSPEGPGAGPRGQRATFLGNIPANIGSMSARARRRTSRFIKSLTVKLRNVDGQLHEEEFDPTSYAEPIFFVGCNSTFRARWDIFILFAVLYEMWVVPFAYSWATIDDSSAVQILDIISGSLFVADLILNFFTTYYQGEVEVFDHKKIAKKYVGGQWFWIDFVSCIPPELVQQVDGGSNLDSSVLKGLKLFRMIRMGKIFKRMDDLVFASAFRIGRVLLLLMYIVHWSACSWNAIMGKAFQWQHGLMLCAACAAEDTDEVAMCEETRFDPECESTQRNVETYYISCTYFSLSFLLGLGAINPVSNEEKYFASVLSIFGACLQACVFGAVAVVISGLDADEQNYHKKMTEVSKRMKTMALPADLRNRVMSYYEMLWRMNRSSTMDSDTFITELSPALQADIKVSLFRDMVTKIAFLQNPKLSGLFVEALVMTLKSVVYLPGDLIIRKGEVGDWMGFIGRGGKVAVLDPNQAAEKRVIVKILSEGDYVGEMSLLFDVARTTDVEAYTWCRLHVLTREDFTDVKNRYPRDAATLQSEISEFVNRKYNINKSGTAALPPGAEAAAAGGGEFASIAEMDQMSPVSKQHAAEQNAAAAVAAGAGKPTSVAVPDAAGPVMVDASAIERAVREHASRAVAAQAQPPGSPGHGARHKNYRTTQIRGGGGH